MDAQRLGMLACSAAILMYFNKDCLFGPKDGSESLLETSELTIPVPSGYHSLSTDERVARTAEANEKWARRAEAMLERPGHSVIGITRTPRNPPAGDPPIALTNGDCGGFAATFAARAKAPIIGATTLVPYSPAGIGTACQFTVGTDGKHMTLIANQQWIVTCSHPPGDGAICQEFVSGIRRR